MNAESEMTFWLIFLGVFIALFWFIGALATHFENKGIRDDIKKGIPVTKKIKSPIIQGGLMTFGSIAFFVVLIAIIYFVGGELSEIIEKILKELSKNSKGWGIFGITIGVSFVLTIIFGIIQHFVESDKIDKIAKIVSAPFMFILVVAGLINLYSC